MRTRIIDPSSLDNSRIVIKFSSKLQFQILINLAAMSSEECKCSYCYQLYPISQIKQCGKCRKRVYCSKECQTADWKSGQGHKYWCGQDYGEEGIDWKIVPISEEKGLGIIALRDIPSHYRIIIERALGREEFVDLPASNNLMPHGGSLPSKWYLNVLSGSDNFDGNDSCVCINISRINHSCDGNSYHELFTIGELPLKMIIVVKK
jgi:hypothetical protein